MGKGKLKILQTTEKEKPVGVLIRGKKKKCKKLQKESPTARLELATFRWLRRPIKVS